MDVKEYRSFVGNLIRIHDRINEPKPSIPRVITMTIMSGREGARIARETFVERFEDGRNGWYLKLNGFRNAVTLSKVTQEGNNRSLKVFVNGKLHLTGTSTPMEGERLMKEVVELVDHVFPEHATLPLIPTEIQLINASFYVPHGIYNPDLRTLFKEHYSGSISVVPQRKKYSGLLCYMFNTTVSIFKTGSVVIKGAKSMRDIVKTYNLLCKVLYTPELKREAPTKNIKKYSPQEDALIKVIREYYLLN
jgi:TATA-box binding protein (TBP) (component of TFIID and TFIIIB)